MELACAVRQPDPCVPTACECVALLGSKNMTCARLRCNGTPSETFFTLNNAVFTSCASKATFHLISSHTSAIFYTQQTLPHRNFYTQKPEALAHRFFFHKEILDKDNFTHSNPLLPAFFTHSKLWHRDTFTHRNFYTKKLRHTPNGSYTQRNLYQEFLHTEASAHRNCLQTEPFTQKLSHKGVFTQKKIAHSKFLHRGVSTQRNFYTQKLLHRTVFTQDCVNNCKSKIGSRRQSRKKHDFEGFLLNF